MAGLRSPSVPMSPWPRMALASTIIPTVEATLGHRAFPHKESPPPAIFMDVPVSLGRP